MNSDPRAICRKWIARLGGRFHPDTEPLDYDPPLSSDEAREYDDDMNTLFRIADPYECAVLELHAAGLYKPG